MPHATSCVARRPARAARGLAAAALLTAAATPLVAQAPGGRAPRPSLTVTVGQATQADWVRQATVRDVSPLVDCRPDFPSCGVSRSTLGLRLEPQTRWGAEARYPLGARWALIGQGSVGQGQATLDATRSVGAGPETFVTGEQRWFLERVRSWRGSAGVEWRALAGDGVQLGLQGLATYGALSSRGDAHCPPNLFIGSNGFCLSRPALALRTPGATLGLDLASPAVRGVRLRARGAADVLRVDARGVVDGLNGVGQQTPVLGFEPSARWRTLPTVSLGLSVDLGR